MYVEIFIFWWSAVSATGPGQCTSYLTNDTCECSQILTLTHHVIEISLVQIVNIIQFLIKEVPITISALHIRIASYI